MLQTVALFYIHCGYINVGDITGTIVTGTARAAYIAAINDWA
jgi:hypothetical protein